MAREKDLEIGRKLKAKGDRARELNDLARTAVGHGKGTDGDGNPLGVTGAERRKAETELAKNYKPRDVKNAKEAALRQAGAKGGMVSRLFGR
jgi:hypothetical protein